MAKADIPCAVFSPGRNLPHNECECGWMRIDHGKELFTASLPTEIDVQEWKKIAEKEAEISHSYGSILTDIGQLFGTAAFVDGKMDFTKLPELVKDMLAVKGFGKARIPEPLSTDDPKPLYALGEGNLPKKEK